MNEWLLFVISTLLLATGNSIYHAERLHYGKILLKKEEMEELERSSDLHKVTNPLKIILILLIVIFIFLLIKRNFWLFFLSLALNVPPINTVTIMVANIIVIPAAILMGKLRGVTLEGGFGKNSSTKKI